MKFIRRHWRRFLYHYVLHADDTPHQIALGVGIAMFVALLPLIGIQTVLAIALAAAFRANKAVCFPIVWITNPVTAAPIYGAMWKLGTWITGSADRRAYHQFMLAMGQHEGFGRLLEPVFWSELFSFMIDVGADLWVGSLVAGMFFGLLSYAFSRWGVVVYRRRMKELRTRLREARRLLRERRRQSCGKTVLPNAAGAVKP